MMLFGESEMVQVVNADGRGDVVLLCEHASNHVPETLDRLGLSDSQLEAHIAWDPGALAVARRLSGALDAPLVAGTVSRLVYDCNRPPEDPGAMIRRSETTDIPGNANLSETDRQARIDGVYRPFCAAVTDLLDARGARGQSTALVTIHSFTPTYFGKPREVELGILHDTDSRLADAMLSLAPALPGRVTRRNEPYGPQDGVTHSLKLHAISRGLPNVMIEIRNDLIADAAGVTQLTEELLTLLRPALAGLDRSEARHA